MKPLDWQVGQMAKAGDGAKRSAQRRKTTVMSLRVDPNEKAGFAKVAKSRGYHSLSAWHRDQLQATGVMGERQRAGLVGVLGQISTEINALVDMADAMNGENANARVEKLRKRLAMLQREIMMDQTDVGQEDR